MSFKLRFLSSLGEYATLQGFVGQDGKLYWFGKDLGHLLGYHAPSQFSKRYCNLRLGDILPPDGNRASRRYYIVHHTDARRLAEQPGVKAKQNAFRFLALNRVEVTDPQKLEFAKTIPLRSLQRERNLPVLDVVEQGGIPFTVFWEEFATVVLARYKSLETRTPSQSVTDSTREPDSYATDWTRWQIPLQALLLQSGLVAFPGMEPPEMSNCLRGLFKTPNPAMETASPEKESACPDTEMQDVQDPNLGNEVKNFSRPFPGVEPIRARRMSL